MTDNYKAEITQDGKFICYISRKVLDYNLECMLDFKPTSRSSRLLISNDATKEAWAKATETISATTDPAELFLCYFTRRYYRIKQALALEFKADEFHERVLISSNAYNEALLENSTNKSALREERN